MQIIQNAAAGLLQLMHKDAGALANLLCSILILKSNSSTFCLGSFLSVTALLQNPFFSVFHCEEKNCYLPLLLPWHILCVWELAQHSWYSSVRKVLCLHPRGKAAWSGILAGIPTAPPQLRLPGEEAQGWEPFLAAVFHLSAAASQAACDPLWYALASTGNGLTL